MGTLPELVEFVGIQNVILGLGRIEGNEIAESGQDADQEKRFRVQWGAGLPASAALQVVADQVGGGVQVLRRGINSYILGEPDSRDLIGRVYYVPASNASEFVEVVRTLASDSASVGTIGDAVVVRDTADGIRIVDELFEGIQSARGQWFVQVQFLELSAGLTQRLGIDLAGFGEGGLTLTLGDGTADTAAEFTATLAAILEADREERLGRVVTSVRLHVVEGKDAELQVGETVPVPSRVIFQDGTAITSEFEDVDTGVLVTLGIRTEPDGRLRVRLEPEISNVSGFVEGRPIRARRRVSTEAVLEPGGAVIAGGFAEWSSSRETNGLPLGERSATRLQDMRTSDRRLYVLARVIDPRQLVPGLQLVPTLREIGERHPSWSTEARRDYREFLLESVINGAGEGP